MDVRCSSRCAEALLMENLSMEQLSRMMSYVFLPRSLVNEPSFSLNPAIFFHLMLAVQDVL